MIEAERIQFLQKPFILPPDVLVFPVEELADHVRQQLECEQGDFAVTRPGMRTFSRIVDRQTALLLEEFRQPSTLADAIVRYSRHNNHDPHEVLEKAFPVLVAFSSGLFLVPADSQFAAGLSASFAPGQIIAGYEVKRLIQVLEDTELYQAYRQDCGVVALKITRPEPSPETILMIGREAAILQHLNGNCCPEFVECGTFRDRSFLTTSWLSGIPISKRAQELRLELTTAGRQQLHQLCSRLTQAYAALHQHGVIHGDIHPHNVLVDATDQVYLLDFGLSRMVGEGPLDHDMRSGLAWFLEPEFIKCVLVGQPPPPATYASDQYAVAALIYLLLCGEHYLTAGVETDALYRQILEGQPLPFTRHGSESWPEVETVLFRALAKLPKKRFASMRAFADAFQKARFPGQIRRRTRSKHTNFQNQWLQEILDKVAYHPLPYDELYPTTSNGSIYFGAAGLVWFLYRAAQIREDAHLLAAADLWLQQLMSRIESTVSFEIPGDSHRRINPASLYLHRCGAHYVHALVSHSRGDLVSTTRQVQAFMNFLETKNDGLAEIIDGGSGALVGGSMLLDILFCTSQLDAGPLVERLKEKALYQSNDLQNLAAIGEKNSLPHLGIAHGWAGILYAQLMVHNALRLPPPTAIHDRLDQLATQAEPMGRGISWVGTIQHPGQDSEGLMYAPGWCSGSAGYVFLWTLAHDVFQEDRFLELAEKASWHAWEHPDRFPNLCCGLTGRAFALLRFYRHSGKSEWLGRAQQLAKFAFHSLDHESVWEGHTLSLFRGALGPALLAVELEQPERAVMPIFESEGWPSSAVRNADRSVR
jgi:serine/threonine-protein kinase